MTLALLAGHQRTMALMHQKEAAFTVQQKKGQTPIVQDQKEATLLMEPQNSEFVGPSPEGNADQNAVYNSEDQITLPLPTDSSPDVRYAADKSIFIYNKSTRSSTSQSFESKIYSHFHDNHYSTQLPSYSATFIHNYTISQQTTEALKSFIYYKNRNISSPKLSVPLLKNDFIKQRKLRSSSEKQTCNLSTYSSYNSSSTWGCTYPFQPNANDSNFNTKCNVSSVQTVPDLIQIINDFIPPQNNSETCLPVYENLCKWDELCTPNGNINVEQKSREFKLNHCQLRLYNVMCPEERAHIKDHQQCKGVVRHLLERDELAGKVIAAHDGILQRYDCGDDPSAYNNSCYQCQVNNQTN